MGTTAWGLAELSTAELGLIEWEEDGFPSSLCSSGFNWCLLGGRNEFW